MRGVEGKWHNVLYLHAVLLDFLDAMDYCSLVTGEEKRGYIQLESSGIGAECSYAEPVVEDTVEKQKNNTAVREPTNI